MSEEAISAPPVTKAPVFKLPVAYKGNPRVGSVETHEPAGHVAGRGTAEAKTTTIARMANKNFDISKHTTYADFFTKSIAGKCMRAESYRREVRWRRREWKDVSFQTTTRKEKKMSILKR